MSTTEDSKAGVEQCHAAQILRGGGRNESEDVLSFPASGSILSDDHLVHDMGRRCRSNRQDIDVEQIMS